MKKYNSSIITGVGRCGTTLLIKLASEMGLVDIPDENSSVCYPRKNYFRMDSYYNPLMNAGHEFVLVDGIIDPKTKSMDIRHKKRYIPTFIKDPRLITQLPVALKYYNNWSVDHAFLCVRDLRDSALSRKNKNAYYYECRFYPLEQMGKDDLEKQIIFNQRAIGVFIETVSREDIPLTVLNFPRFALDVEYTYNKLKGTPMECSYEKLQSLLNKIVDKELINTFER